MNLFDLLANLPATSTQTSDNGAKGVAIVDKIVEYTSSQGRKANHYVASVQMGKGQWEKDVDDLGNEVLTSKPTLLIQVYPASQKEAFVPCKKDDGSVGTKKVAPCATTKQFLATLCKAICTAKFDLKEYTEQEASKCADLKTVLQQLSDVGVAVDKDCKKFSMKTFYLLPDGEGKYYLKAKGYNPNRK